MYGEGSSSQNTSTLEGSLGLDWRLLDCTWRVLHCTVDPPRHHKLTPPSSGRDGPYHVEWTGLWPQTPITGPEGLWVTNTGRPEIAHSGRAFSLTTNKPLLLRFARRRLFPGPTFLFFFFSLESWEVGGDIFSCYFQASFLVTVGSSEASRKPSHGLGLVTPDSPGLPAEDRHAFLL